MVRPVKFNDAFLGVDSKSLGGCVSFSPPFKGKTCAQRQKIRLEQAMII